MSADAETTSQAADVPSGGSSGDHLLLVDLPVNGARAPECRIPTPTSPAPRARHCDGSVLLVELACGDLARLGRGPERAALDGPPPRTRSSSSGGGHHLVDLDRLSSARRGAPSDSVEPRALRLGGSSGLSQGGFAKTALEWHEGYPDGCLHSADPCLDSGGGGGSSGDCAW